MKPKRREMLYCKGNHICVHGSDYHFAMSLSCTMSNVEQNACICLIMGIWLEIGYLIDIIHVILCGDDRFILCADDHLSASFARLYALGEITAQFIFVSITPQFAGIGTPAITRCLCIMPLCLLCSIVDCFRLLVRYLSQTISTLLTVSGWEVIYGRNICWEYSSNVRQAPGLTIWTIAALSDTLASILEDEYLLIVRSLLSIPLGPISIPVAVGPYQKWTEGTPDFHVQRNCRGCFA